VDYNKDFGAAVQRLLRSDSQFVYPDWLED